MYVRAHFFLTVSIRMFEFVAIAVFWHFVDAAMLELLPTVQRRTLTANALAATSFAFNVCVVDWRYRHISCNVLV